jgi:hypothetical protein
MISSFATHAAQRVFPISFGVLGGYHLIRCLAPKNAKDKALPTEEWLTAIECRLDGMQAQLDGLTDRVEDLN